MSFLYKKKPGAAGVHHIPNPSLPHALQAAEQFHPVNRSTTVNVHEIARNARKSVANLLTAMDEDGNGEIEQMEMLNFFADHIQAAREHGKTKRVLFFTFFVLVLSLVSNAIAMSLITEMSKENKTRNDGAITNLDGDAASIGIIKSYGTLFDLPYQSVDFMKQMKDIVIVVDDNNGGKVTTKYTIDSWEHFSTSNMILSVGQDTDIHLVDGTGWVQKFGVKYPILIDTATTADSGRRYLAEGERRKLDTELRRLGKTPGVLQTHTFTWDELVSLHANFRGEDEMRRLSSGGDALSDLYMFFGGVVESEVLSKPSALTASCDATGTCGSSVTEAPRPDVPSLSKWDTVDDLSGGAMTWFMDLSDTTNAKIHIVSEVGTGSLGHEVFVDGKHYTYRSVDVATIDHARVVVAAGNATTSFPDALAAVKDDCEMEYWDDNAAENADGAFILESNPDGSAIWQVGGWHVTVAADGTVTQISDISVLSITSYDATTQKAGFYDLFETCLIGKDYQEEFASVMEADNRRLLASSSFSEEDIEAGRHLAGFWDIWNAAKSYYSTGAEYGQYCGKGFPYHCSKHGKSMNHNGRGGVQVCADGGMDASCSKHDSGSYHKDLWGVATMNYCEVDRVFKVERNSGITNGFWDGEGYDYEVQNGANVLFDLMPCIRWEGEHYWRWKCKWYGCWPERKHRHAHVTKWAWGNYQHGGCKGNCYKSKPE
mmetsp:Transcript_10977/g.21849  ORF Transcript_10977/g.21849 Transcript_10977/m.21849 type:complete len:714 (-) Transcript_10977:138-2279(-)|eukprot:CAMPEP_0182473098 /NCGR_PEP_ID=MMETSP1319-20130603/23318_1 /TAXON_ID=172717 /ORGANISM="Bolidomonas pacifica, Strain RCC208" /LENGTH=713 /DNA_ID=CAMNT_0024673859 /DNA_START=65 /DNA_END=2206 /DNA_ORIENTATION=+